VFYPVLPGQKPELHPE